MAADRVSSPLTKEVLPPHKANNGLGVMLVASLAMFFAVASSAFVLRARMVQSHCRAARAHTTTPAPVPREWVQSPQECGKGVKRVHRDGSWSMEYRPCPPSQNVFWLISAEVTADGIDARGDSSPPSIEVRRIR